MPEKKRPEKMKLLPELDQTFSEISISGSRSLEPFIKTFIYRGENVASLGLGTLVGVFAIDEHSEDAAYVVNFLASVAKKEYFSNPRRGAVESFESALHKLNLALAELVKHGNVAWLGKLQGAIGIFEKNSLHFTVTGAARILLFRNETVNEVSEGLTSDEASLHPIKTFVEVSSGRLFDHDRVVFTTPELLTLFPPEALRKNAARMDNDHFVQFLKTALVNEFDIAGVLITDIIKSARPTPARSENKKERTSFNENPVPINVFSESTFVPPIKANPIPDTALSPSPVKINEYIDTKTGHIYVQGHTSEDPSSNPILEHLILRLQDLEPIFHSFSAARYRFIKKMRRNSLLLLHNLSLTSVFVSRRIYRVLRRHSMLILNQVDRQFRKLRIRHPEPERAALSVVQQSISKDSVPSSNTSSVENQLMPLSLPSTNEQAADGPMPDVPPFLKEKLAAFYKKNALPSTPPTQPEKTVYRLHTLFSTIAVWSIRTKSLLHSGVSRLRQWSAHLIGYIATPSFGRAPGFARFFSRQKKILAIGAIVIFGSVILFLAFRQTNTTHPDPESQAPARPDILSDFPISTEKNAHLSPTPTILTTQNERLVTSVSLRSDLFLITEKNILNVSEEKQYPLPPSSGTVHFVTAMDDLQLLFLLTDTNELFSWSPISRTFAKHTLAIPSDTLVAGIGAYLTYLYILDARTDQIYRFPRAEGGFGQPVSWLKDPITIEDTAQMAVNETIFIAPGTDTIEAFFRGKKNRELEMPTTKLILTSLFTRPGLDHLYALDATNQRILVWNQDGTLSEQYYSEKLTNATSLNINEKTNEAIFTASGTLFSLKLNPR